MAEAPAVARVIGNALSIEDVNVDENDVRIFLRVFDAIELNLMTQEEVLRKYRAKVASIPEARRDQAKTMLGYLAVFILANGIHENLRDDLRVTEGVTWKNLKEYWGFKSSEKQMFVRWCVPIMYNIHNNRPGSEKNLMLRQAHKWGLEEQLEEINAEYRFFGSYFIDGMTAVQRSRILAFQQAVINLSQGGRADQAVGGKRVRR